MKRALVVLLMAGMASSAPLNVKVWYGAEYVSGSALAAASGLKITRSGDQWQASSSGHVLVMTTGKTQATLDGQDWNLSAPPRNVDGEVLLPLTDLREIFVLTGLTTTTKIVAAAPPTVLKTPVTPAAPQTQASSGFVAVVPAQPTIHVVESGFYGGSLNFITENGYRMKWQGPRTVEAIWDACEQIVRGDLKTPSEAWEFGPQTVS